MMSLFAWDEAYSVGVAGIDRQHQRLVEMINRLYEVMRTGDGDAAVRETVEELANYTLVHFAAEETLMRKVEFPGLRQHVEQHKRLVDKVMGMLESLKTGKMVATVSLASFMKDWLVTHIQEEDRQYGLFIKEQRCDVKNLNTLL